MMKCFKSKIFSYEDLIRFYRRIFAIFYWQCYLPASIDSKISKLSCALNRHVFLYALLNFISYVWCLHTYYCQSLQHSHRHGVLRMISTMYAFPVWVAASSIILSFDNFKKIWFDLMCLDDLILKRLSHKNNYHKFRRSILIKIIFFSLMMICCGVLKSIAENEFIPFRESTYLLKLVRIYIELHAIFVISLHHYMYKMFCKYINFAYHLHQSNLVFLHIESIDMNIKYYKEIHYKFWQIACELNNIFGITIMTFCCQTSIEAIISVCHVFASWDEYYVNEYSKIISKEFSSIVFRSYDSPSLPGRALEIHHMNR